MFYCKGNYDVVDGRWRVKSVLKNQKLRGQACIGPLRPLFLTNNNNNNK